MEARQRWFLGLLGAVVALRIAVHFVQDSLASIVARAALNEARSVAAGLACLVAAHVARPTSPRLARAWLTMALSFLGWIVGIALHFAYELDGSPVVGTLVDPPYLLFYPVFLIGLLQLPVAERTRDDWLALTFELAVVLIAAFLMVWVLTLRGQLGGAAALSWAEISAVAYAFGDVLLIWGAFYVLVAPTRALGPGVRGFLALGAVLLFATDITYSMLVQRGAYATTDLIGLGWTLGLASFAVAGSFAWGSPGARGADGSVAASERAQSWLQLSGTVSITLSTVCLGAALLVAFGSPEGVGDPVTIGLVALVGLLFVARQLLAARTLARLRTALVDANASLERRVAERTQQLATERDRSAAVLASVQDAIIIHDLAGRVLDVNPAMLRMYGVSRAEALALDVADLATPDNPIDELRATWPALAPGESRRFSWTARRHDGAAFPVEIVQTRFHFHDQPAIAASVRDMSDYLRIHAQLQRAQRLEAVGRLAGGVAHDFNNLLVPILGYADLLLDTTPEGDPAHEDLGEIKKAAGRAKELVQQLLSFGRKSVLEVEVFDLNTLLVDFEKMLRRLIREDTQLRLALAPGLAPIRGDRFQIEQVVMNLVVNARDAMPSGGAITLTTAPAEVAPGAPPAVLLSVSDTGVGMDDAVQARLFEPFFTTKVAGRGTGLGLATVFGIVEQHGGHVTVASRVGAGSTFTVRLPAADRAAVTAARAPSPAPVGQGGTILLVEDDEGVRTFAKQALVHHGYDVVVADTARRAIDLLADHRHHFDLVLSDVVMPDLSGREVLESARRARPDLPVLLMSGYAYDVIDSLGAIDAAVPLIQKPFGALDLARKVHGVLHGRAA